DEARAFLQTFLLEYPVHPLRPQGLFLAGWTEYRCGRPGAAARFFSTAATEAPRQAGAEPGGGTDDRLVPAARAIYWASRAQEDAGRRDEAELGYLTLLRLYPLSYYAELAHARLGSATPLRLEGAAPATVEGTDRRLLWAQQALYLGWRQEALAELAPLLAHPEGVDSGRDLLAAARLLRHLGREATARHLARIAVLHHAPELGARERERAWHLAFPTPFAGLVEAAAGRHGLSPWLLFGLVLRESGFRRCATSRAGAVGLMQLTGPAAADAARDLGLPAPTRDRLCEATYNLRLGTWHLRKLLSHYQGSLILALAAYNAGPGWVDRWLERMPGWDLDAFVEEIPFEETRTYVRAVISAMRAYTWIYGETPGTQLGRLALDHSRSGG
ncbi:MAG: lytic transglycosylase domain-containing protein, partial [Deltaproteobacteria bacterium]